MKVKQDTPRRHHTPTQVPTTATASRIPRVRASSASIGSDISFLQLCFADCVSRVRANRPGVHSAKQARVVSKAPSFPPRALLLARCDHPCAHVTCVQTRRPGRNNTRRRGASGRVCPEDFLEGGGERDSFEWHRSNPCPAPSCSARAARSGEEALSDHVHLHGTRDVQCHVRCQPYHVVSKHEAAAALTFARSTDCLSNSAVTFRLLSLHFDEST